jgi:hypothetical protein
VNALSRRDKLLLHCAPMREEHVDDRPLRTALHHARKTPAFATQQNFDRAAAALVQAVPIPKEIIEWVPTETFIAPRRPGWKKYAQNPVFLGDFGFPADRSLESFSGRTDSPAVADDGEFKQIDDARSGEDKCRRTR